jgi:hypothetical protein
MRPKVSKVASHLFLCSSCPQISTRSTIKRHFKSLYAYLAPWPSQTFQITFNIIILYRNWSTLILKIKNKKTYGPPLLKSFCFISKEQVTYIHHSCRHVYLPWACNWIPFTPAATQDACIYTIIVRPNPDSYYFLFTLFYVFYPDIWVENIKKIVYMSCTRLARTCEFYKNFLVNHSNSKFVENFYL